MTGNQKFVDGAWWDAAFARQGHTGWADQQVYAYDQPLRRASVARAIDASCARLEGVAAADVGCGTGDFALMMSARGARVVAIDFSAAVLEVARQRAARAGANVSFACASATQIPAENAAFDLITSITVLQHLVRDEDLRRGVAELARVLRPNGRVIFLELAPPLAAQNRAPDGHVVERPPDSWRAAFAAGGLAVEREFAYPQYGITALRLLARAIDRLRGTRVEHPNGTQPADDAAVTAVAADAAPGFKRRLLRGGWWLARSFLLLIAWPLDHLLRLQVPRSQRYYRLWLLKKSEGES
jgi:2-polyprenyl-3-methyl-5-hydroxy-6-metoxy-1,4-benzoquinol methylase